MGDRRVIPAEAAGQVEKLVSESRADEQALYVIAAATGMRIAEILGLEARHIVNKGRTLVVEQSVNRFGRLSGLKTRAAKRNVDASKAFGDYLLSFIEGKSGLLFKTKKGTTLRAGPARVNDFETVLTKFSEFFIFVPIPGFSQKNFAPGTPESDDSRPDRPTASPLLSLLKRISLFQSRSPLAADRLLENLGLLICAVMSSLLYHRPPPTGSGSGVETGLLIQTWLGRAGGLGALPTKRSG